MKSLYYFETIESEKLITKLNQNLIKTNPLLPTVPGLSLIFTYYSGQIEVYFLMDNINKAMIKWKKFRIPWYNKYKNITLYKLKPSFNNSEKVYQSYHMIENGDG